MTFILYNPLANGGHGEVGVQDVQNALADRSPETLDITALDARAFFAGRTAEDEVILCGGDGTIHRLVNELEGRPPAVPIYVWRFGTGNDFLRDAAPKGEDRVLLNDFMRNLPVVRVQGSDHRYLNGCSVGVDAVVCGKMAENVGKTKKSGYFSTAIRAFFQEFRPMSGRVTVDGETREYEKIWMACAMNGQYQGGGMKFAPGQDRKNDTLTCFVWHGTTALGTLLRFPFVIPGKHTIFAACDMRKGREITVELEGSTMLQLDGEVMDGVSGYSVRK